MLMFLISDPLQTYAVLASQLGLFALGLFCFVPYKSVKSIINEVEQGLLHKSQMQMREAEKKKEEEKRKREEEKRNRCISIYNKCKEKNITDFTSEESKNNLLIIAKSYGVTDINEALNSFEIGKGIVDAN